MPIQPDSHAPDLFNSIFTTTAEKIGAVVAASMIATPLWMQYLEHVSQIAALCAPILGCIYLMIQIGYKLLGKDEK